MAQLNLQPPGQFDFKNPDDWPRWKRRFKQFRVASGLTEDSAKKQISTLLYCLGEEAEAVLASTNATADERKVHDTVVSKFDGFFGVRKNVIFERARFNRRNQQDGEGAEHYIMALYELAANCDYGDLREEMIRDRLVVGIRDSGLSERLQLDADLDLNKATKAIRQREAVHQQQQTLKGAGEPGSIAALHSGRAPRRQWGSKPHSSGGGRGKQRSAPPSVMRTCTRCGKDPHSRESAPQRMQPAIAARRRVTMELCAAQRQLLLQWRLTSHL